jgi:hypothetical protein
MKRKMTESLLKRVKTRMMMTLTMTTKRIRRTVKVMWSCKVLLKCQHRHWR